MSFMSIERVLVTQRWSSELELTRVLPRVFQANGNAIDELLHH